MQIRPRQKDPTVERLLKNPNWRPAAEAAIAFLFRDVSCPIVSLAKVFERGSRAQFTTCFTWFDELPRLSASPPYVALIGSLPAGRVEVVMLAEPRLSVPVRNTVVLYLNVTISPSGTTAVLELTTAVKVTACPDLDGFGEDESTVVVPDFFTSCFIWFDELPT